MYANGFTWESFYEQQNQAHAENFFGNLTILRKAKLLGDPYVAQLERFGMDVVQRKPYDFRQAIATVQSDLHALVESGRWTSDDLISPAKAFRVHDEVRFLQFGDEIPADAQPLNLLSPIVFVDMLSQGYFPIGEPIREATNQTLAEHDLAHLCGFLSNPLYMSCVRDAFRQVATKVHDRRGPQTGARLRRALEHFDSLYSLRLYYLIEVFSEVRADKRTRLQQLLGRALPLDMTFAEIRPRVHAHLQTLKRDPVLLYDYLDALYSEFYTIVNPLGGESRDIFNRRRKFQRGERLGSVYDRFSKFTSKFDGNSIWSLYQNACAALENVRSTHANYDETLESVHLPLIGALIGTSQLTIGDWVLQAVQELPDKESPLYKYLNESGLWEPTDLLRLCHSHRQWYAVLENLKDLDSMAISERIDDDDVTFPHADY